MGETHFIKKTPKKFNRKWKKKEVMLGIEIHGDEAVADESGSSETYLGVCQKNREGKCAPQKGLLTWEELGVLSSPLL